MITRSMNLRAPGFPRDEQDDEMPNPFMSGHRLASFVQEQLKKLSYREDALIDEDWGWLLMMRDNETGLPVEVRFHYLSDPDGDERPVSDPEFVVAIEPCQPTRRRAFLFKEDISGPVRRFSKAVFDLLSETEGIVPLSTEEIAFD